jgi:hypothetical protein
MDENTPQNPAERPYDIHTSFGACARSIDLTPYSDGGDSRLGGGDGVDAGAFGDERLEKDPMRVDGGLTW